jgi:hypothetical protein
VELLVGNNDVVESEEHLVQHELEQNEVAEDK